MTGTFAPRSHCVAALCCFRLVLAHTSRTQVTQPPLPRRERRAEAVSGCLATAGLAGAGSERRLAAAPPQVPISGPDWDWTPF